MNYHYSLQGLIYNLIKDTKYAYMHDKAGFKFFSFSNLIPVTSPILQGEIRTLLVSSPDSNFITVLHESVEKLNGQIKIGAMKFRVDSSWKLNVKAPVNGPFTLITGTPIIIRIPREKYEKYNIKPPLKHKYLYWRADHPLELFLTQLWDNLRRKYNEYFRIDGADRSLYHHIDPFRIFSELVFKKQISTKLFVKNTEQTVIGTTWEFLFDGVEQKEMIQLALDLGMGERNSMGFGFMNIKK